MVGIVGALDIPLIHVSVSWLRSLHPDPVVLKPEGPSLHPDMLTTLMVGLAAFTLIFFGLFLLRYGVERLEAQVERRAVKDAAEGVPTETHGTPKESRS